MDEWAPGVFFDQEVPAARHRLVRQHRGRLLIRGDARIHERSPVDGVHLPRPIHDRWSGDGREPGADEKIIRAVAIQVEVGARRQRPQQVDLLIASQDDVGLGEVQPRPARRDGIEDRDGAPRVVHECRTGPHQSGRGITEREILPAIRVKIASGHGGERDRNGQAARQLTRALPDDGETGLGWPERPLGAAGRVVRRAVIDVHAGFLRTLAFAVKTLSKVVVPAPGALSWNSRSSRPSPFTSPATMPRTAKLAGSSCVTSNRRSETANDGLDGSMIVAPENRYPLSGAAMKRSRLPSPFQFSTVAS